MEVSLLNTLSMVSLRVRETEKPFLEKVTAKRSSAAWPCESQLVNALFLVPEGKGNVLQSMRIRYACNTVLTPAVGSRPGMIV